MAASISEWMPAQSSEKPVKIGPAMGRWLKARAQAKSGKAAVQPSKTSSLPEREFFAIRYGFKPESADSNRPGTITKESETSVILERSGQPGEEYIFKGKAESKERDCILIWDEVHKTFILEKIECSIPVSYTGKPRLSTQTSLNSVPQVKDTLKFDEDDPEALDLQSELLAELGRPDSDSEQTHSVPAKRSLPPQEAVQSDVEEETLEFGRPSMPLKKQKVTPVELPPAEEEEEEEDEWDEINANASNPITTVIVEDEGQNIDVDALEGLMADMLPPEEEEDDSSSDDSE